jgi:peroxiredoxin
MPLEIGAIAPDFTLKNQFGEDVTLSQFRGKKPVVIVFFPLAFSGICTGELCEIRDNIVIFDRADVELLGVSVDSHFTLRAWAEQERYSFQLLSDRWPTGAVASAYDVFVEGAGIANRATFVIDKEGRIVEEIITEPGQARDFAAYRAAVAKVG